MDKDDVLVIKTIIISGGAGFLGKNLIEYLINKSSNYMDIIVLDNFITSSSEQFNVFKKQFEYYPNVNIILYDFDIVHSNVIPFIKERHNKVDYIYHLASLASPPAYKNYPIKTLDVGYIGTKNMLDLALYYTCPLLFASTSEVYGDALQSPQKESYYGNVNSFGDRGCYDESKRVAEALCYTYIKSYGVDVKIARIFNSFGKYMSIHDGRIITEIIKHLINNTELTIYGNGEQTRSICYAYDTVDMLVNLMNSTSNFPVNIGNNKEMSINDTVKLVYKIYKNTVNLKSDLKIIYKPLTQDDPLVRNPCLELNEKILGKKEYTDLEIAILKTINYFVELSK